MNTTLQAKDDEIGELIQIITPFWAEAVFAVNFMGENDVLETMLIRKPSDDLVRVVKCVCVVFGEVESWEKGREIMADIPSFLKKVQTYNRDKITHKMLSDLKKYTF